MPDLVVQLRVKAAILSQVIREAQKRGDVRWKSLIPKQRKINELLVAEIKAQRKARGEPEPPPVVVGIQTIDMHARRLSHGRG